MKTVKNSLIGMVLAVIAFYGCDSFDDINTNPDTTTKVPSSMLCTNILLQITKYSGDAKAYIADNALPKYVAYANEGKMAEQYNRLGRAGFGYYTIWPKANDMVQYALGDIYEDGYRGVAHFARAYALYDMTMRMGDIPCSEAGKGDDNFRPAYDTQEQVFITILNELQEAASCFEKATGRVFTGDVVYDGDPELWRKACNSFALKVLMTLSLKTEVASLEVTSRFAKLVEEPLLNSNEDNFRVRYADETGKYHPLYDQQKFTSNTIVSSLLVNALKELNDYRLFYYAEPSELKLENGLTEDDMDAYVGVNVEDSDDLINQIYNSRDYSQINNRYHLLKDSEPLALISYAEQHLILAEAAERGWISGSSKDHYEAGVKAALSAVGSTSSAYAHGREITQEYIDSYFMGEAAYKTTTSERLEQIWLQRYLLHFMQNPLSSYFDYRRTGYPEFPVNPNTTLNENNKEGIPMRWLYPENEATTNRSNLETALDRQYDGYDEINKIMWILK